MPDYEQPEVAESVTAEPESSHSQESPAPIRGLRRPAATESAVEASILRRALNQFFRTGTLPPDCDLATGTGGRVPALVYPYLAGPVVRGPFPLVFQESATGRCAQPLGTVVDALLKGIEGDGDEAEQRRRFVTQIEQEVRSGAVEKAVTLDAAWKTAAARLRPSIRASRLESFDAAAEHALTAFPDATLLSCEPATYERLASFLVNERASLRAETLLDDARTVCQALENILSVEKEESHEAVEPERLRRASGGALADAFDFDALSHLLDDAPHAATLPTERRQRIEALVEILQSGASLYELKEPVSLARAEEAMSDGLTSFASLLRALEAARLETMNRYDEQTHGSLLAAISETTLTSGDLRKAPPVLVSVDESDLDDAAIGKIAAMLVDGRPWRILLFARDDRQRATRLSGLAMSTGSFVMQSVISDPETIIDGLGSGVAHEGPALFLLYAGPVASGLPDFLRAAVARDGRAFPTFQCRAGTGVEWAERLSIQGNDAPDDDWPAGTLSYERADGTTVDEVTAFTWVDFAVSQPQHATGFLALAPGDEPDGLQPFVQWLGATPSDRARSLPFVWTATLEGELQRTIPTAYLVETAVRVRDEWHRLRELGGVANSWADRAKDEARVEFAIERDAAIADAAAAHEREMESAVSAVAETIISNIASGLLDMPVSEASGVLTQKPRTSTSAPALADEVASTPAEPEPADEPEEEEDEPLVLDEAYIETVRCTTCNECTTLNGMMFAYNDDRQAFIKDPTAGPYRDLVMAAEKCPVRIIHPGKPGNSDEPGLEDLIERAKPYL